MLRKQKLSCMRSNSISKTIYFLSFLDLSKRDFCSTDKINYLLPQNNNNVCKIKTCSADLYVCMCFVVEQGHNGGPYLTFLYNVGITLHTSFFRTFFRSSSSRINSMHPIHLLFTYINVNINLSDFPL